MDTKTRMAEENRLKKLFHKLDANNDGRIDIHELTEELQVSAKHFLLIIKIAIPD